MSTPDSFRPVFDRLRAILAPHAPGLVVTVDAPDHFSLDAPPSPSYPKGLFFGSAQVRKRYVSYHLMPVYAFPDMLDGISDRLRKRMQGKSCFNFTAPDEAAFAELTALTEAGLARYRAAGLA